MRTRSHAWTDGPMIMSAGGFDLGYITFLNAQDFAGDVNTAGAAISAGRTSYGLSVADGGAVDVGFANGDVSGGPSLAVGHTMFTRVYMKLTHATTVLTEVLSGRVEGIGGDFRLAVTPANYLAVMFGSTGWSPAATSTTQMAIGTWYRIQWAVRYGAGSTDQLEVRIGVDGNPADEVVYKATGLDLAWDSTMDPRLEMRCVGYQNQNGGLGVVFDDWVINDDQPAPGEAPGSAFAADTWQGDGASVLLSPAADQAVGAGWTKQDGTTPVFPGVNVIPQPDPLGYNVYGPLFPHYAKQASTIASDLDLQLEQWLTKVQVGAVVAAIPFAQYMVGAGGQLSGLDPVGAARTLAAVQGGLSVLNMGMIIHHPQLPVSPVIRLHAAATSQFPAMIPYAGMMLAVNFGTAASGPAGDQWPKWM